SRSAEPQRLVLERLPCLATAQPAAAATSAAAVEMLKVVGPPPVPAVSTRAPAGASTCAASRLIVRARPTSSATVSPLARSATRKAAVWTSPARPSMISSRTAEAWSAVRCAPEHTSSIARVRMSFGATCRRQYAAAASTRQQARGGLRGARRAEVQEVPQHVLPARGQDRLGVELDALGRQLAVAHAHDDVAQARGQRELGRQLRVRDQRVVAAGAERALEAGEDPLAVVLDRRVLAVDGLAADRAPAERLDQGLVAEADAECRHAGLREGARGLDRDAGLGRRGRAGREHQALRATRHELAHRGLVVSHHLDLGAELAQVLDEVVGEGVVVVAHEDPHDAPAQAQSGWLAASSTAWKAARALLTDSSYS